MDLEVRRIEKMETVLVVGDSRGMQRTMQRLLEADSLQIQIASDGISGLEIFRRQPPSAVMLDLKLPDLSKAAFAL
ncbi:MAG: response regulator [Candidatus Acidiferrum sp.]|jgi:CheY-like chemotaxis protein